VPGAAQPQLGGVSPAQAYVARRIGEGKTKRETIRALKRYIVRAIWRLWQECAPPAIHSVCPQAARPVSPEVHPRRSQPQAEALRLDGQGGGAVAVKHLTEERQTHPIRRHGERGSSWARAMAPISAASCTKRAATISGGNGTNRAMWSRMRGK